MLYLYKDRSGARARRGDLASFSAEQTAGRPSTAPYEPHIRCLTSRLTQQYAFSLVLLAPLSSRTSDGFDYRVLLLKRHAKSRTYDSAHVMPGPCA